MEWSENVEDAFYPDVIKVMIEKTGDSERSIELPEVLQ